VPCFVGGQTDLAFLAHDLSRLVKGVAETERVMVEPASVEQPTRIHSEEAEKAGDW
jgi:hypothetical protein